MTMIFGDPMNGPVSMELDHSNRYSLACSSVPSTVENWNVRCDSCMHACVVCTT